MKYDNLQELIQNSQSSRSLFLSLPAELQCKLHEHNAAVHSAADLHRKAAEVQTTKRLTALGKWNPG